MRLASCALLVVSTVAIAGAPKPADTARKILDAQFAALRANDATRRALYDPGAVLLGSVSRETVGEIAVDYIDLFPTFGSVQVDSAKVSALVAGGAPDLVWFTAGVTLKISGAIEGSGIVHSTEKARVTQLAVHDGKAWKVVASLHDGGAVARSDKEAPEPLGGTTATGPLAPLLASPKALADALSSDPQTFVLGTEASERAIGPAAGKKLLARWAKLSLAIEGKVREVETKTYGFAQARVKWTKGKDTYWMDAMLVAVPAADGTWKVVGVHYANTNLP